jgi:DNA gyrase subunit A
MVVSITASGYAKRTPLTTYRQQRRGGRGVMGMNMKEGDYIEHLHVCSTHDYLLFFTNQGKVYRVKVYELPEGSRASRGRALANFLPLKDKEKVMAVIPTRDFSEGKFLVFGTKQGMVKKTPFKDYDTPIRADGIIAIKIRKGDELVRVRMTSGKDDIIMVSKSGHATRFAEKQARPMGRGTAGVKGMNVADKGNEVLSLDVVDHSDRKGELLVVTENGYGKRTTLTEYPVKGRGAKGVLTAKLTAKKGGLAGARVVREGQELIFISQSGMVQRNAVSGISRMGRPTQGVRLMNLKKGDRVSAVALVVESTEGNGNGAAATAAPVEDDAPTAETVAEEAAAAEAAGNGEATVTKAKPSRSSGSATQAPAKKPASKGKASAAKAKPKPKPAAKPKSKAPAAKPKAKPKPAPKKRSSSASAPAAKPKAARPKVKPKHTATAKQRAETARKKR